VYGYGDGLRKPSGQPADQQILRQLEFEINQTSDSYVHAAITPLVPAAVAPTTQPDSPKGTTVTVKCLSADNLLQCTFTILGLDARGAVLSEVLTFQAKAYALNEEVVKTTNNAFDAITSVTEAGAQNTPANWSWRVGVMDKIGLIRKISSALEIYKIKRNNGEDALANYTIDATYWTITPAVPWNASGEYLEIHYVES
jgi:hypothetical protein